MEDGLSNLQAQAALCLGGHPVAVEDRGSFGSAVPAEAGMIASTMTPTASSLLPLPPGTPAEGNAIAIARRRGEPATRTSMLKRREIQGGTGAPVRLAKC
jgi:hypothetical protein